MKLVTHKSNRESHWSSIDLTCLEDSELTPLAKCLHIYALTRPPGWEIRIEDLTRRMGVSKRSVYRAMKELEDAGYLVRDQQNIRGHFQERELTVYELPQTVQIVEQEPCAKNRHTVNRGADNRHAVNRAAVDDTLSNNQSTNNQERKNQERVYVEGYSAEFNEFWAAYPRREARRHTWYCWIARLNDGVKPADLILAARHYAKYARESRLRIKWTMMPATFLGEAIRYQDWMTERKVEDDERYSRGNGPVSQKAGGVQGDAHRYTGGGVRPVSEDRREQYRKAVLRGSGGREAAVHMPPVPEGVCVRDDYDDP